jgi:hypothetical protein
MGTTSKTIVDDYGNPPPSNATHYINHTRQKDLYRPGDSVGFVKVLNDRVCLLQSNGIIRKDCSLTILEEIGYIVHTLKTLEELMEEYLEK